MGVRGKLFSLAKVNATTACEAIRAIKQLSATKGSGASHTCDVPQNDLPLSWTQIGSPENDSVRVRARRPPAGRRTTGRGRPPGGRAEAPRGRRAPPIPIVLRAVAPSLSTGWWRRGNACAPSPSRRPRRRPRRLPATRCRGKRNGERARALVIAQANASVWHSATKRCI